MQFLFLLKLFGEKIIAAELGSVLERHTTAASIAAMAPLFQAGADACKGGDDAAVAQAIADLLFSIK